MILDSRYKISHICPRCSKEASAEAGLFDLTRGFSYTRGCGGSRLSAALGEGGLTVMLTCPFCAGGHSFIIPRRDFYPNGELCFSCPETGMTVCRVGPAEGGPELSDYTAPDAGYDEFFVDNAEMLSAVEAFRSLHARRGIICSCGSHDFSLNLAYDALRVTCSICGASRVFPASR